MKIRPQDFGSIVILTGAGISAESGISTFRDSHGLWEQHRVEDVATPEAFARNPQLVWRFYSLRRIQAGEAKPNSAHHALVEYAQRNAGQVTLITQNVDGLHTRADGERALNPLCMHGSLEQSRCTSCDRVYFDDLAYLTLDGSFRPRSSGLCRENERQSESFLQPQNLQFEDNLPLSPCCGKLLRPHIVWFGEVPHHLNEIGSALEECDLFVSIGTSGQVYPAAGFLQMAKMHGATTVCINRETIPQSMMIDYFFEGSAGEIVPKFFRS